RLALVMRSPQLAPVRSIHQVSLYPHFIAVLGNAANQNHADSQLLPDFLRVVVLSLKPEDRASRHYLEIRYLRQGADQAFSQTVAEVFIVRIGGRVHKGQDGDRINLLSLRRSLRI